MSLISQIETVLTGGGILEIHIAHMPANPDNVVALYRTGGYNRGLSGSYVEEPTFQVRIRNTNYVNGENICNIIKDLLHGFSNSAILIIEQQGDILDLGRDERDRQEWSMNFRTYYIR